VIKRRSRAYLHPPIRQGNWDHVVFDMASDLIVIMSQRFSNRRRVRVRVDKITGYGCKRAGVCKTFQIRYRSSLFSPGRLLLHIMVEKYILYLYPLPVAKTVNNQSFHLYDIHSGRLLGRVLLHVSDPCGRNMKIYIRFFSADKDLVITYCGRFKRMVTFRLYITTCLFANASSHCKLPKPSTFEVLPPSFPFLTAFKDLVVMQQHGLVLYRNKEHYVPSIYNNIRFDCPRPSFCNKIQTIITFCTPKVSISAYEIFSLPLRGIVLNPTNKFCRKLPVDFRYNLFESVWQNITPFQGDTLIHLFPWHWNGKMKVLKSFMVYYPTQT
jgi:hypothetical protein